MACRSVSLSLLASASLLLLVLAGCESHAVPKPTGSSTITLKEDSRRGTLNTKLGMEIVLELPRPKPDGHVWQTVLNNTTYLLPLSDVSTPQPDTGRSVVRFLAVRVGRSQLKFAALPPGVKEARPGDTYDLVVVTEQP